MPDSAARALIEVDAMFGRIEAFADDLITDQIIAFGAHTRPELALLLSMVDAGDSVFDLGGHIGSFAVPLAQKAGASGRIVVVEGLAETCAVLERNMRRLGGGASITVVNALIAPPFSAYDARTPTGNTGATYFEPSTALPAAETPTTTLDALGQAFFYPRILKIDLEGFEEYALSGAPQLLAGRPVIYAEVAGQLLQRNGSGVDRLDAILSANGYRYFRNIGERNAAHDRFTVVELRRLQDGGEFFDVLAVHRDDERLSRVLNRLTEC